MKTLFFLITAFLAQSAFANLNWDRLEVGAKYILTADIVINSEITLKKGDAFTLEEFNTGEVPVLFFTFKNLQCRNEDLKSEMVLFNPEPEDTTDDKSVGVELSPGCHVEIFVETRHYGAKSAFAE